MLQKFTEFIVSFPGGAPMFIIYCLVFLSALTIFLLIVVKVKKRKRIQKTEGTQVKKVKRPKKEKPSLTVEETIACLRRKRDDPRRYGPIRHGFKYY